MGLAVKAALAAALAWHVAGLLPLAPAEQYPYYAPLGAVIATSTTLSGSVRGSVQSVAAIALGAAVVVFAAGQCLHGTEQGPLVADLADPRLIGRYMALASLSWQFGFFIDPAFGGAILDAQPVALWLLLAAICAAGSVWSLALERRIPVDYRRTPRRDPVEVLEAIEVPVEATGVPSRT